MGARATNMIKLFKILVAAILLATCLAYQSSHVNAAPFACSPSFYQVIGGQLKVLDPITGVYNNIGADAGFSYNAIGYNVLDNYIYGIAQSGATGVTIGDVIRISSDGTVFNLGAPTGGIPISGYVNGSMDTSGNLYIITGTSTVYKINVSTLVSTQLTITGDAIADPYENVFMGNKLYSLVGSTLSVVDLSTNNATNVTVSGPSGWVSAGGYGAGWATKGSELFFSSNSTGAIYQISNIDLNANTATATFQVAGTSTFSNDGASCIIATLSPFDAPIATNDQYTTPYNTKLTQTISVLQNDIGNDITITAHTEPTHGSLTLNSDGTFTYTPTNGFSGTDSFTYTITDSSGRTATATVTITVSPLIPLVPDTGYGQSAQPTQFTISASLLALGGLIGGLGFVIKKRFV